MILVFVKDKKPMVFPLVSLIFKARNNVSYKKIQLKSCRKAYLCHNQTTYDDDGLRHFNFVGKNQFDDEVWVEVSFNYVRSRIFSTHTYSTSITNNSNTVCNFKVIFIFVFFVVANSPCIRKCNTNYFLQ